MRRIPFHRPRIGAPEVRAVVRALRSGRIGGNGVVCRRAQERLAELVGARHALLAPSATAAFEVALEALGIGPGDEVLLPSFAFVSQAGSVVLRGARPVFCDVDPATLCLDPADVERRIGPRARAVVPVHYAGVAADLDALGALAERHGLALVEDAAQAIGARWRGRHLGTVGRVGFLSFHVTKNLTCGEGGALLTDDEALFRRAEVVQEKGTDRSAYLRGEVERYTWVGRGSSYVLSDLAAALLDAQLDRLDEVTASRRRAWALYHDALAPLEADGLLRRPAVPAGAEPNGHLYWIRARDRASRDALLDGLRRRGVEATFHFQPLHLSPFAKEQLGVDVRLPETEAAADTLVRLPLWAGMTKKVVARVTDAVARVLAG